MVWLRLNLIEWMLTDSPACSQQNHDIWQIWNLYNDHEYLFLHLQVTIMRSQVNNRFAKRYNVGFGFHNTSVRITRKDDCYYLSSKIIQTKRSIMEILTKMHFTKRAKETNSVVLGHSKRTDNKRFVFTRNIWPFEYWIGLLCICIAFKRRRMIKFTIYHLITQKRTYFPQSIS